MKRLLPLIVALLVAQCAHSQITITASDMPVSGDMLSYSNAPVTGTNINPGDSGVNVAWNYTLSSTSIGVDTYKLAYQVDPSFANTISFSATGYKVADSIPGLSQIIAMISTLPVSVSITNIYTWFQQITTPRAAYLASAMSYNVESIITIPTAANYTDPDVWYFFPLTYGNATDSQNYELHLSLMSFAGIDEVGYRKTRVDGWGTITTPFYTTPINCIRVRSEIHEIDSVNFSGTTFGFPRNTVEYKWLANGVHYPVLWVTSNVVGGAEIISTVRYRDTLVAPVRVVNETPTVATGIKVFPNPTTGIASMSIPADWKSFVLEVFDAQGKVVSTINNDSALNLNSLANGQYFIRITSGSKVGYTTVIKN